MLCKNFQYISTVIVAGVNCGMFYAISVIIIQAAAPYGYTDQQGGIAMAVLTIAGYVGGTFVSMHLSFIICYACMCFYLIVFIYRWDTLLDKGASISCSSSFLLLWW